MTALSDNANDPGYAETAIDVHVDVVVIGGGIAGLWTLAALQKAGYHAVLLESDTLGAGQTRYAQGIIHGGTKYALTGKLTASSEAVADMPARWRACHEGKGDINLGAAILMSDAHYLWSTNTLTSKISGFFASKVMRNRSSEIDEAALPAIFRRDDFRGQVYRLDEPVFDTMSVVRALAMPRLHSILAIDAASIQHEPGAVRVRSRAGEAFRLRYRKVMLMAGEGNEQLLQTFAQPASQPGPLMQRRPLKMVVMRGGLTDQVYAHCLGASVNPRITITSHFDSDGDIVWYMGGQLAEDGVNRTDDELLRHTCSELQELIPWLDLQDKELSVLEINRAEISQAGKKRPDNFTITDIDEGYVAWPTKMALSPALADALLEKLQDLTPSGLQALPPWTSPTFADFPWNDNRHWLPAAGLLQKAAR